MLVGDLALVVIIKIPAHDTLSSQAAKVETACPHGSISLMHMTGADARTPAHPLYAEAKLPECLVILR